MATSPGEPRRDVLGSAAAVALLAAAAADVKRRGEPSGGEPPPHGEHPLTSRPSVPAAGRNGAPAPNADVAAVGSQQGIKGKIDAFQASRRPVAFVVGVIRRFGDDRGGRLAALISYYSFFSLFPALLALTTILGFVLQNNTNLADDIRASALAQFPALGNDLANASHPLSGSVPALVIGLAGAIWAGLAAAQAAQDAMNSIWDVPRPDQPTFLKKRLRSILVLVVIALLFAANSVLPQLTGVSDSGVFGVVVLLIIALVVDAAVFAVLFRILAARDLSWSDVWVGAVVAAVGYVALQSVGTLYVQHVLKGAAATYGVFATVIGLLSWLFLLGQVVILSAEVNVVRVRRLWPRSLFNPPSTEADRRSQRGQVQEAKLTDDVDIEVEFTKPDPPGANAASR